jgi:hypothetical protein
MFNICPVCGYEPSVPFEDSDICYCCGTQFGYHDCTRSYAELRTRWIESGSPWHSKRVPMPFDWDALTQLVENLKYKPTSNEKSLLHSHKPVVP